MDKKNILLISQGSFEKTFLESIAEAIFYQLGLNVFIEEGQLNLNSHYDPARRQYNGNTLLIEIDSIISPKYQKKVALFRVDLFIPILTYIFGQAGLNGSAAIASLYRLRNEQYGLKKNDILLLNRFRKVVLHELGHTFGLLHCHNPSCVMRSSTYVEDIDQKNEAFCSKCRDQMSTSEY